MINKITTHWAHVKVTSIQNLRNYVHLLVPCSKEDGIEFQALLGVHLQIQMMGACVLTQRRESGRYESISSLEVFVQNETLPTILYEISDVINGLNVRRGVVLRSDAALFQWLEYTDNRNVFKYNAVGMGYNRPHLIVKVIEEFDEGDLYREAH